MVFLHRVEAIAILDAAGKRIFAKYYVGEDTPASSKALANAEKQRSLEFMIQQAVRDPKTSSSSSAYLKNEIVLIEGHAVVFAFGDDVTFLVIGDGEENEMVLSTVLTTFVDALKQEINVAGLSARLLLENYDAVLLTVDEMLDGGIILETNASSIAAEVEPFIVDTSSESARKVFSHVNKYLRENM